MAGGVFFSRSTHLAGVGVFFLLFSLHSRLIKKRASESVCIARG